MSQCDNKNVVANRGETSDTVIDDVKCSSIYVVLTTKMEDI